MILSRRTLRPASFNFDAAACLLCQSRPFSSSYRRFAEKDEPAKLITRETPILDAPAPQGLEDAPRSYGKSVDDFKPRPLSRPIGLSKPPLPGDNVGFDTRTWKEKRADFLNHDKTLIRRKELIQKVSTPYFRDWSNMKWQKGKSFLAPPGIFKAERALFFPNFRGETLVQDKLPKDTTPVLEKKISVVSVFSSAWAENQVKTFVSEKANPALHEIIKESNKATQLVHINVEDNAFKAWIIKLFMGGLRKSMVVENWNKYFLVRKGITDEIREAVGLLNSKVGYVYLLDGDCRIRWAGSGVAEPDEKESLVKATKRVIEESRTKKMAKLGIPVGKPSQEKPEGGHEAATAA